MTKKLLLILCMSMLIVVGGCNSTSNTETEEVEEDIQKEEVKRELIDSLEYKLADNLPTISIDEQFINIALTD